MPRRATSPATPPPVRSAAPTGTRRRETDRGARHPAAGGAADATARSGACECHEAPALLLPCASDDESASSGERADRVPPDEGPGEPLAAAALALQPHLRVLDATLWSNLHQGGPAGAEQLGTAPEHPNRLAADADVSVGEQDVRPSALARPAVEQGTADRHGAPGASPDDRRGHDVDAERGHAPDAERHRQAARTAAEVESRARAPVEQAGVAWQALGVPRLQRQRLQ